MSDLLSIQYPIVRRDEGGGERNDLLSIQYPIVRREEGGEERNDLLSIQYPIVRREEGGEERNDLLSIQYPFVRILSSFLTDILKLSEEITSLTYGEIKQTVHYPKLVSFFHNVRLTMEWENS